jgi:FkbM family methyltransferase
VEVFQMALSDSNGRALFRETNAHPASSMLPLAAEHMGEAFPHIKEERSYDVEMRRLDEVLGTRATPDEIIIKMDVQGVEDRVIAGGMKTFGRARAVLVEMSFAPLYQGQSLFEEVHEKLAACGLRFAGARNQIVSTRPIFAHCIYLRRS